MTDTPLQAFIRGNRQALERELADSPRRQFFSPAAYSQYTVTLPLLLKFARGRLIDLGCGNMPFRSFVSGQLIGYDSLDLFPRHTLVTYVGDIQNMTMIQDETYDTALCMEVLEHVPDPFRAAREIYRILKPGGILVMSVPHLSRLHDEPHDYYRYTRHGVRCLLEQAGFEVLQLEKRGGIFSFVGHQFSTLILGLVWRVPVVKAVAWSLNSWLITRFCYWLDGRLDASGLFALGYSAVARKAGEPSSKPLTPEALS